MTDDEEYMRFVAFECKQAGTKAVYYKQADLNATTILTRQNAITYPSRPPLLDQKQANKQGIVSVSIVFS